MLRVSEVFRSVQGEGLLTGVDSVFLRTSGCNLRCRWCDTPYAAAAPEGVSRPVSEAIDAVLAFDVPHFVLTGGEPLLPRDATGLTKAVRESGRHVTIETAATVYREVACDLMSISPKRANSTPTGRWRSRHESTRDRPDVVRTMLERHACQFKFVCAEPADADDAARYVDLFPEIDRCTVFLMPEGVDAETLRRREEWLRPRAERAGFRYGRRLHVELFGDTRGT